MGKSWFGEGTEQWWPCGGRRPADEEARGLGPRQRRNLAAVLGDDPPDDDKEETTP